MTTPAHTPGIARPSVLLFGATSTVGVRLLPLLREFASTVSATCRGSLALLQQRHPEVHWIQAALADAPACANGITHILSLGPSDLFVDWLARQAPHASLRQVIAFGSTSADTKIDSSSAEERALAQSLRQSEQQLAEQCQRLGVAWTLLRPTLIYGGDTDLVAQIAKFARRWHVYPRPLGRAAGALRQPVHASDLAQAVVRSIDNPAAANRRFDLPGPQSLSLATLVCQAARAGSRLACPIPLPLSMLLRFGAAFGVMRSQSGLSLSAANRLGRDQVFDMTPARIALGFAPRAFEPELR